MLNLLYKIACLEMLKQHVDPDKYSYSGYRTGYDTRSLFAIPDLY